MDAQGEAGREAAGPAPPGLATPDLVIFDCDGVLIDSEVISARVLVELAAEVGITVV